MSSSETSSTATNPRGPAKPSLVKALVFSLVVSAVIFTIGMVTLLLGSRQSSNPQATSLATTSLKVGQAVPSFSLPGVNVDGPVGIANAHATAGRPTILIFFASWCAPCKAEMPKLAAALRAGAAGDARLIGIAAYDHVASISTFIKANGVHFEVGNDASGHVTSGIFGFPAVPETVLIDTTGLVKSVHFGATSTELLRRMLASL